MEAEISLSYKTDRQARAIADAVSPDNARIPEGLIIKTTKQGRNVLTHIRSESGMLTFMATIDDLLAAVSVAEESISTMKNS